MSREVVKHELNMALESRQVRAMGETTREWALTGYVPPEPESSDDTPMIQRRILAALTNDGMGVADIAAKIGGGLSNVSRALTAMTLRGDVVRAKRRNGCARYFVYWKAPK